mmetsp:Transcript_29500/g.47309  ORF Transcript_29500/g.47309 Transcript_29500/m.47309 type:complete len:463 (+) Transcript_29500:77-1465(+)
MITLVHLKFFCTLAFTLASFLRLSSNFFVVLLKGCKVLTSLGELSLFHTFSDVPVDECTLSVHKVELVVDTGEDFCDSSRVGDHAHSTLNLSKVSARNNSRRLIVDTALESSRGPVNELNGTLGLNGSNSSVHILRDNVTTVHEAACHVLSVTRVTFSHHRSRFESGVGDLSNGKLLVVCLLSRDDRSVRGKHEVNTRVRDKVGLELSHIHVKCTIETKGSSEGRDNLSNQTVEVGVGRTLDVEGSTADIVDSLVVKHNSNIGVLEKGVGGKDGVVWLNNSGGDLRRWVDSEAELGLLTVVYGKTLKKERSKSGSGSSSNSMEDKESLKTSTVVCKLTNTVQSKVNDLLTNGVMPTSVVVGSVFLTGNELLRVEELTVGSSSNFIDSGRLKIEEDATRDVLSSTSLGEEGVESVVSASDSLIGRHLSIGLDTVLEAVKFPAGVTNLDTGLAEVEGDNFTHCS